MSEKKPGFFSRLAQGLKRSSTQLGDSVTAIFTKRKLDSAALEELLEEEAGGGPTAGPLEEEAGEGHLPLFRKVCAAAATFPPTSLPFFPLCWCATFINSSVV